MPRQESPPAAPRYPINGNRALIAAGVAAGFIAIIGAAITAVLLLSPGSSGAAVPRAVIVDQLALTDPNPEFVEHARQDLEAAGYTVDTVPSDAVTVDYYRDLPARGYKVIVLRSHTSDFAGSLDPANTGPPVDATGLFTNEQYSRSGHVQDQRAGRLMVDGYVDRDIPWKYFGITADYILHSTRGRFDGTTIVLMGCSGLKTDDLARAFLSKGATDFVSWDKPVTAEHTDAATSSLLTNLFEHQLDLREAVARTMADVGPDPAYGSKLVVYP